MKKYRERKKGKKFNFSPIMKKKNKKERKLNTTEKGKRERNLISVPS